MMSNWGYHWSYNQGAGANDFITLVSQLLWFAFVVGLIVALIVIVKNYFLNGKKSDLSFLSSVFSDSKQDTQNNTVIESGLSDDAICPCCGQEVMMGLKYCPGCGAELIEKCPNCSKEVQIGWKYCTGCGSEVLRIKEV